MIGETYSQNLESFINFINEDKSKYPRSNSLGYVDLDDDFLVGESGGFLMNMDFVFRDTYKLREVGEYKEKTGTYTEYEIGELEYENFRLREEDRRKNGYTQNCKLLKTDIPKYNALKDNPIAQAQLLKPLRITGAHYNFINYGRIRRVYYTFLKGQLLTDKREGLPRFFDSQYWWYKSKEFAKNNNYNLPAGKARRAGFSYMNASDIANITNLYPKTTNILCAYDKKYLILEGGISTMVRDQLNFYEEHTPFNRCGMDKDNNPNGLMHKDIESMTLGYRSTSGVPSGYLSSVISVSFGPNNPDAAIGKDAKEIVIEELSNAPNLFDFLAVTNPTTTTGSFKTGIIVGFGTGGSKEGSWVEFEKWFYELAYDAMPFENIWDNNMRHTKCGYFKPYIQALEAYDKATNQFAMDEDGNSNYELALKISNEERDKKIKSGSIKDFTLYCSQYGNCPSETFGSSVENMFSSPELNMHIDRVKHDTDIRFHRDGMVVINEKGKAVFKTNSRLQSEGNIIHPFIETVPFKSGEDLHGCIREWYSPYRDSKGNIPDNLYRISYDPFGVDKQKNEINYKHSLGSIKVRMTNNNFTGNGGNIIVASFAGRPETTEEADRICMLLCLYYNAKALVEVDRGDTVKNFKKWGVLNLLIKEPIHVYDKTVKGKNEQSYGIVLGTGHRKLDGLNYLKEWLYSKRSMNEEGEFLYNLNFIYDLPFLLELQKWNNAGNFDRVSDAIVAMYDDKELEVKKIKAVDNSKRKEESVFSRAFYKSIN